LRVLSRARASGSTASPASKKSTNSSLIYICPRQKRLVTGSEHDCSSRY
jgi:hypothetical protein